MTAVVVRGGGVDVAFATSAPTSLAGATVPASGGALAGSPEPARASSPDELTVAIVSAMTLFGRVEIHHVDRQVR